MAIDNYVFLTLQMTLINMIMLGFIIYMQFKKDKTEIKKRDNYGQN